MRGGAGGGCIMASIGFTGTREGLTTPQYVALRSLLGSLLSSPADTFHHGDCIGSDAQAHDVVRNVSHARIIGHPPDKKVIRAFKKCDYLMAELPYLVRNRNIVDATDQTIATPDGPERQRSGTWSTVRYALKRGKPVSIVWPDGRMEVRGR